MPNWKTTLNIKDLHEGRRAGELTIQQVAAGVAARLKLNKYAKDGPNIFFTILDVIDELESIAEDVQTPQEKLVDEYDGVLEELYNFGDCGHRIWIKTA